MKRTLIFYSFLMLLNHLLEILFLVKTDNQFWLN